MRPRTPRRPPARWDSSPTASCCVTRRTARRSLFSPGEAEEGNALPLVAVPSWLHRGDDRVTGADRVGAADGAARAGRGSPVGCVRPATADDLGTGLLRRGRVDAVAA